MKLTMKKLLAIASSAGYDGDSTDFDEVKQWLIDEGVTLKDQKGKTIDVKAFALDQPDDRTLVVQWTDEAPAEESAPVQESVRADDIAAKVAAALAKERAKDRKTEKPDPEPTPAVQVKSGEQRMYEHRVKRGVAAFPDYETAKGWANLVHYKAVAAVAALRPDYRIDRDGDVTRPVSEIAKDAHERMVQWDQRARNKNVTTKDYQGNRQSLGAALLDDQYESTLTNLVLDYGVARKVCTIVPMNQRTVLWPKCSGSHTVYYPDEGGSLTTSDQSFSNLQMHAKTGAVLTKASEDIIADSNIPLAEHVAREHARRIAYVEDNTLWNGLGTVTSGGYIPNVTGILQAITLTAATNALIQIGGGTAAAHSAGNIAGLIGLCKDFTSVGQKVFYCSPYFLGAVLLRIAGASGGVTMTEFANNQVMSVYGYPVVTSELMPKTLDASARAADIIFGDVSQVAYLGDRMAPQFDVSTERYFDTHQIGLRTVVRHAMVIDSNALDTTNGAPISILQQT